MTMTFDRQDTTEMYVRSLLNLIYSQSRMVALLMAESNGAAAAETQACILSSAENIVKLAAEAHIALCDVYGSQQKAV